jgi:hypothetical protein
MELVALLGSDKESWGQVSALVNHGTWETVILVKTTTDEFPAPEQATVIDIDSSQPLTILKKTIMDKLRGKFSEFEACLSIASGNGKEHMALIAALLSLPVGIRLVAYTKTGVEFIN